MKLFAILAAAALATAIPAGAAIHCTTTASALTKAELKALDIAPSTVDAPLTQANPSARRVSTSTGTQVLYQEPVGTFWPMMDAAMGGEYFNFLPLNFGITPPAGVTMQWKNQTNNFSTSNKSYSYPASGYSWDFNGQKSTTKDLPYNVSPVTSIMSGYATPTLTYQGATYQLVDKNNNEPVAVQPGGSSAMNDAFWNNYVASSSFTGITPHGGSQFNGCAPDFTGPVVSAWFAYPEADATWMGTYGNSGITDIKIKKYGQVIKVGAPMALKEIRIYANVKCNEGAKMSIHVYEMQANGQPGQELIYSDMTLGAFDGGIIMRTPIGYDDDNGELVPYLMVDKDIMITLEGFYGNSAISRMWPVSVTYGPYANNRPELYSYAGGVPMGYVDCKLNGTARQIWMDPLGLATADGGGYNAIKSLYMLCKVEYPYQRIIGRMNGDEFVQDEVAAGTVDVSLKEGETAEYVVASQAAVTDVKATFGGLASIPLWMDYSVTAAPDRDGSSGLAIYYYVKLGIKAGMESMAPAKTPVVLDYMGQQVTFNVVKASGIADIDTEASQAPVTGYYDLMGRRVDASATGMRILRRADGSAEKQVIR